mmetsp:Transcript_3892/g.8887  ORF Transcript_3892/g.8887 Transcript_3892/m.8887 type:complete len:285 (-) Transcript_3892:451-1305(-)
MVLRRIAHQARTNKHLVRMSSARPAAGLCRRMALERNREQQANPGWPGTHCPPPAPYASTAQHGWQNRNHFEQDSFQDITPASSPRGRKILTGQHTHTHIHTHACRHNILSSPSALAAEASELSRWYLGHAVLEVDGHGHLDELWLRQAQVGHQLLELGQRLRQPGVVALLLPHTAALATLIVVSRVQEAALGQREDLRPYRPIQQLRVTALEISPATAADEECVSREGLGVVVQHKRQASRCVARGAASDHVAVAKEELGVVVHVQVSAGGRVARAQHAPEAV